MLPIQLDAIKAPHGGGFALSRCCFSHFSICESSETRCASFLADTPGLSETVFYFEEKNKNPSTFDLFIVAYCQLNIHNLKPIGAPLLFLSFPECPILQHKGRTSLTVPLKQLWPPPEVERGKRKPPSETGKKTAGRIKHPNPRPVQKRRLVLFDIDHKRDRSEGSSSMRIGRAADVAELASKCTLQDRKRFSIGKMTTPPPLLAPVFPVLDVNRQRGLRT